MNPRAKHLGRVITWVLIGLVLGLTLNWNLFYVSLAACGLQTAWRRRQCRTFPEVSAGSTTAGSDESSSS